MSFQKRFNKKVMKKHLTEHEKAANSIRSVIKKIDSLVAQNQKRQVEKKITPKPKGTK